MRADARLWHAAGQWQLLCQRDALLLHAPQVVEQPGQDNVGNVQQGPLGGPFARFVETHELDDLLSWFVSVSDDALGTGDSPVQSRAQPFGHNPVPNR